MSKVSSVTFHYVLKALEQQSGITIPEMLNHVSIDKELFQQHNQIASEKLTNIFQYCVDKTQDEALALKIGSSVSYHSLGLLGYLMIHTNNLQHLIDTFFHYQKIISGFIKFHLEKTEAYYKLSIYINENPHIEVPQFHAEVHMSAVVSILSQIVDTQLLPSKVCLSSKKSNDLNPYHQIFGKNIYFEQDENTIYFDKKSLSLPIINSNSKMLHFFELQAREVIANLEALTWYVKVQREILKTIGAHDTNIDFIAQRLNISARILQYNLKNENKTFREALLSVRMQLAQHYISKTKMDLNSIAFFLGYNEASSFYRAYKKYFKCTPNQLRV